MLLADEYMAWHQHPVHLAHCRTRRKAIELDLAEADYQRPPGRRSAAAQRVRDVLALGLQIDRFYQRHGLSRGRH